MLEKICAIAKAGGDIMLRAREIENAVTDKPGVGNFVTKYDVEVQETVRTRLLALLPDAHFVGEENHATDRVDQGWAFIVDPIDGTMNFIRHADASAVSIALLKDGALFMAAAYDPYRNELFSAEAGRGAFLNGKPFHRPDRDLAHSLCCAGTTPYDHDYCEDSMALAKALLSHSMDLRRSGSAVLDGCHVACGRFDLCCEPSLSPWDHAAYDLIIREAGGVCTQIDGSPLVYDRPCSVLNGAPAAHADFFRFGFDKLLTK